MSTPTTARRAALLTAAALCLVACGGEEPEASSGDAAQTDQPTAQRPQDQTAATNERPEPDQTLSAAGFEVSVWDGGDAGSGQLRITRGGEEVYAVTGERFVLGARGPSSGRVGLGEDVTGDGAPNLVVELWTGGTTCCVDLLIYELAGETPELLGRVSAQTGGRFEDYDGDGSYEIRVHDGAFLGWNASVTESPAPPVILRWDGLWYAPAPDLMRAPAPTHEQLAEWQRLVESGEEWDAEGPFAPPAQLWGVALDLMYTGHPELGTAFLQSAWNDEIPGRDAFTARFLDQLEASDYWLEIAPDLAPEVSVFDTAR